MKSVVKLMSISLILLMLISVPVFAIGSSTGSNTNTDTETDTLRIDAARARFAQVKESVIAKKAELREEFASANCEDSEALTRKQRIRCRLSNGRDYIAPINTVPEACRRLSDVESDKKVNPVACVALYKKLRTNQCYDLDGIHKSKCFRRAAGFVKAKLSDEDVEDRHEKAVNYLVALLYDLQERIENLIEEDKLSPEDGAVLIDQIVETKEAIMNGESKSEVRELLQELRAEWRSLVAEAESLGEDDE